MLPAYHNWQLVVLDKRANDYRPGDVVAFRCEGLNAVLVKRIAAGPGDTVQILNGTLYVNGEISRVYSEKGIFEYAGMLSDSLTLDDGEYIVIGDNIAQSRDSRYAEVGIVEADDIIGKLIGAKPAQTGP